MQTIVETPEFLSAGKKLFTEEELDALKEMLARNPRMGDLMAGTGGFRKLRLARKDSGKSGGYRVITFFQRESKPLYLITAFAKNTRGNLSKAERNELRKLAEQL